MNERPVTLISNAVLGMIQPASKTGALLRVQSHTSLLIASWQNIQMSSHNSTWHSVSKKLAGILLTSHFWNFTYKCQPLKGSSEHRVQRSCSPPDWRFRLQCHIIHGFYDEVYISHTTQHTDVHHYNRTLPLSSAAAEVSLALNQELWSLR